MCDWISGGYRRGVARLILPRLEMHGFGRPDADQDTQDLDVRCPQRHRWIQAVTTLFDCREMKRGGICDHLKEIRISGVAICSGNRGMLSSEQVRHRLWKHMVRIQIRVVIRIAVPRPPAGVDG